MSDPNTADELREEILQLIQLRFHNGMLQQQLLIKRELVADGKAELSDTVKEWRDVPRDTFSTQTPIDWENVDWNKTTGELASELNASYQAVCKARGRFGHKALPNPRSGRGAKIDWSKVDWSKPNSVLSRELMVNQSQVQTCRVRLGGVLPGPMRKNAKATDEAINAIDWKWTRDTDICITLGITRERVRQIRLERNKPECLCENMGPRATKVMRWLHENREAVENKKATEVMLMIPGNMQRQQLRRIMVQSGIPFEWNWALGNELPQVGPRFTSESAKKINWKIPNVLLAKIWRCPVHRIANLRCRSLVGKPTWHVGGAFSRPHESPELMAAVKSEIEIAKQNGQTPDEASINAWIESKKALNAIGLKAVNEMHYIKALQRQKAASEAKARARAEEIRMLEEKLGITKNSVAD